MAKQQTTTLALKVGHPTPFRRTVTVGQTKDHAGEKKTLLFEPGQDYELTPEEVAGCQQLIDCGLLVDPNRDPKGRQRKPAEENGQAVPQDAHREEISQLGERLAELERENSELETAVGLLVAQVKELGGEPVVGFEDGEEGPGARGQETVKKPEKPARRKQQQKPAKDAENKDEK